MEQNYSQPTRILVGIPQGSVLRSVLYILYYTADVPTSYDAFTALFAGDTAAAARNANYNRAVGKLCTVFAEQDLYLGHGGI